MVIRVLKYLLLDERIIVIGDSRNEIVHCCDALRKIMYPFKYGDGLNWYMSYISLRDFERSDWPYPGLIGMDKKLINFTEVQESTTWILDLDTCRIWQS